MRAVRQINRPSAAGRDVLDEVLAQARRERRENPSAQSDLRYKMLSRAALPGDGLRLLSERDESCEAVDEALEWLALDPFCTFSGYTKGRLMRRLASVPMSTRQAATARRVLLGVVPRGPRQETRDACRLARAVADDAFRDRLRGLAADAEPGTRQRAAWMLAACER